VKRVILVLDFDPKFFDTTENQSGILKNMKIGQDVEVEYDHDDFVYLSGRLVAVSVVDLDTDDIEVMKTT
jgi:hypothetical protein